MSQPFVAEIRIFPFNFAPTGWAMCNGQIMAISQNTALFSLLGTQYGGDGKATFALPDLQGNVPLGQGTGPGLSPYVIGETGGEATHTLLTGEIPSHSHGYNESTTGGQTTPSGNTWGPVGKGRSPVYHAAGGGVNMLDGNLSSTGSSLPHNNLQPYLTLNFCIALQGVFPSRN
jgi:microcystin-dependent protein